MCTLFSSTCFVKKQKNWTCNAVAASSNPNCIASPVNHIFGIRDNKGKFAVKPRVRYYSEDVGESFFDYLAKLERILPSKLYIGGKWYYVFDDNKANRAKLGTNFDGDYFKRTGKLRVPVEKGDDGLLQAILFVDSYPAMLPEGMDVEEITNQPAQQASMFSREIKRVKGRLRKRRIAVFGVNQLRLRPMVMYGSPEYEPAGEALKFFSDVLLMNIFTILIH